MGEWEDKLGAILSDPQAMSRIMALAQSLSGGTAPSAEPAPEPTSEPAPEAAPCFAPKAAPAPEEAPDVLSQLDPRLMRAGMQALAAYREQDNTKVALLLALKPFLQEEKHTKVDRAVKIARLSRVIRAALDGLRGGEERV